MKTQKKLSSNILWRIAAICYTVLLFFLNFIRIFDNDFWGDEGFTIRLAQMSIPDMLNATAQDVHPPLFYIFNIAAYRIFGSHGWVYHGVALLPYALSLIFFLTVIWKKFGKIPALLMVTFSSVLSSAVIYNVEARMYSWAALFVLLSYYGLYLILADNRRSSYIIFILSSLAAAYTHYYAMISVAFFYLALLLYAIFKKIKFRNVLITYITTIVGYLPWLFQMLGTFRRTSEGFWMDKSYVPGFIDSVLYFFSSQNDMHATWYPRVMMICAIVIIIGSMILNKKTNYWILCGIIASIGTVILGELISILITPSFTTRYIYPVSIVFWLAFSISLSKLEGRKILACTVIALTLIACLPEYYSIYSSEKAMDIRNTETERYARKAVGMNDIILTNITHLNWTLLDYFVPGPEHIQINSVSDCTGLQKGKTYWLFWSSDLSDSDLEALKKNGYSVTETFHDGILGMNEVHIYKLIP